MLSELFCLEKITNVCEKILYFFVVNLMFLVCNMPVLLFLLFVGIGQARAVLPLFLLCLSFLPPGLSAVFFAMNRLLRGKSRSGFRDYWEGYLSDFGLKMKLSLIQMFVILVLWTNVEFFAKQIPFLPLMLVFGILLAFVLVMTPNLYLLASRYQMSGKKMVKAAAALTLAHPVNTLGTLAALGISMMAFELSQGTAVLFMVGVYGFLVVFMSRRILDDLERSQ